MNPAVLVDESAGRPILVFGSLPPDGRDLDLLVRDDDLPRVAGALESHGFLRRDEAHVYFEGCNVELVDLVASSAWGLPPSEEDALFAEALPIEGFRHLVRPAPHHALLILARRVIHGGGRVTTKLAAKLAAIEQEEPNVWRRARKRAPLWGAVIALDELAAAATVGDRVSRVRRAAATTERLAGAGEPTFAARSLAWRSVVPVPRKPVVVSFSGLDGSGKTTQATQLKETLEKMGMSVELVWSRLTFNPSLEVIAAPIKLLLKLVGRVRRTAPDPATGTEAPAGEPRSLRQRSPFVAAGWATIVAIANGSTHRRLVRGKRKVDVVITDRYILDSVIHLRHRYAAGGSLPAPSRLVVWLSPSPVRAYLLDVDAETAAARKDDEFGLDELREQAALYREESERIGVTRLNGDAPKETLCERIARDVWGALQ